MEHKFNFLDEAVFGFGTKEKVKYVTTDAIQAIKFLEGYLNNVDVYMKDDKFYIIEREEAW